MRYIVIGFIAWWLIPGWILAIALVLLFMHGATCKKTPTRRKR